MRMDKLRSREWYAGDDRNAYLHRAWMRRGLPSNAFQGRPQIAIANTASDLTPCNSHLNEIADAVKQGVYEAGGIPLNLPVVSLGETLVRPTAMLWRNMAAMAMEEMLEGAHASGRLAVELVHEGRTISEVITRESFHNAIVTLAAIGGSTNAVVHLLAIAGRLGIDLRLEDFDRIGAGVPLLVNLQPAGKYLMEDLFRAGGPLAVLQQIPDLLDPTAITVTGSTLVQAAAGHTVWDADVITSREEPLQRDAGIRVLRGNLAPRGAVVKPAAASPDLLVHRGPAVVFDSVEDLHARIDDPALPVTPDSVLVLRGCGPKGYPGMPEVANMPLPRKMLEMGVRDMVRVCDGRMSGTAYGTVVLHVAPEAAAGGLLAVIQDGDPIVLDAPRGLLQLDVTEEELIRRTPAPTVTGAFASPDRGWQRLYVEHVQQADTGADLDFLVGASGPGVARESH
jgi:dihydroxyacid dehydratase/phosphogluconate dehydratase